MAKYDLTISGSLEEIQEVFTKLTGSNVTVTSGPSIAALVQPEYAPNPTFTPLVITPAPATTQGIVDADGLPYDARIHSSSKKQNKDGRWASKKNTDPVFYNQIIAELRGNAAPVYNPAPVQQQPAYNPAPQPQYVPPQQPAYNPAPVQQQPQYAPQQQPQQPAFNPPPAMPLSAPIQQGTTITDLFNKIQSLLNNGTDPNYFNSINSRLSQMFGVQVTSINDIADRPDMIAQAFNFIAVDGK